MSPARSPGVDKALLVVLAYNCLAGVLSGAWAFFKPGLLFLPPSHFSWIWLPILGMTAALHFRSSLRKFHLLAMLFYLPQIVVLYGPMTIKWQMGMNFGIAFGDPEVDEVFGLVNIIALLLAAMHGWRLVGQRNGP